MNKRILPCLLAGVLLLCGVQAYAAGGASDSLVSVSYLNNTFLPALQQTLQARAKTSTQAVYDAAIERLDGLGNSYLASLGGAESDSDWNYSASAAAQTVKRGDTLTLAAGATLVWIEGAATASATLVDATSGTEMSAGTRLTSYHRYINGGEGTSVTISVLSDAASATVEGAWSKTESSEDVTGFTDLVQSKDWFYDAVRYVTEQGLFQGMTATQFAPTATMDRSMLATVLYRMEGQPAMAYQGTFPDVADGQWYTVGIEWAAANGIVNGLGDGTYGPAVSITREQIASMLYRYAGTYRGLDVSQTGDLTVYADYQRVSDWAQEGMSWAVGAGIISGADGGTLLPGNNASRAEVATMLQRFQNWANGT